MSYQKKSLSYSLLTNPGGLFSIDGATGELSLTRSVDYEGDSHQFLLLVRAEESEEQFSTAAEVGVPLQQPGCSSIFLHPLESGQVLQELPFPRAGHSAVHFKSLSVSGEMLRSGLGALGFHSCSKGCFWISLLL